MKKTKLIANKTLADRILAAHNEKQALELAKEIEEDKRRLYDTGVSKGMEIIKADLRSLIDAKGIHDES